MVRDNREAETEMERRRRRRKAEKLRGLKRRRRRLVLAILAVLFLPIIGARIYFGVNPVILKNSVIDVDKGNYASLGTDGLFDAIRSQSLATTLVTVPSRPQQPKKTNIKNNQNTLKPVTVKVEKVGKAQEAVSKNAVAANLNSTEQPVAKPVAVSKPALENKETATPSSSKKNNYYIIVSSLPTANDAQQVLNEYKQKGYKDVTIIEGNGRYRLSLCNFADKAAAYKKLNELKQNDAFKNAWILSSK